MKTLLINGSLKNENSNTFMVAKKFAEGVCAGNGSELEIIHLSKMNIEHCVGCFCCWKVTPGQCAIRDDMDIIREKILESDVIILSFPLYFFGVSSKMKTLIDRLLPFKYPYNGRLATQEQMAILDFRPSFDGKKFVIVSSCAHASTEYVFEGVEKQFDLIFEPGNYSAVFCPQGEILKLEQMKSILNAYLNKVHKAGEEFGREGAFSEQTAKLMRSTLVPPKAVEKMMTGYSQSFLEK
jgi:multimeric flavodoxin WrbA